MVRNQPCSEGDVGSSLVRGLRPHSCGTAKLCSTIRGSPGTAMKTQHGPPKVNSDIKLTSMSENQRKIWNYFKN